VVVDRTFPAGLTVTDPWRWRHPVYGAGLAGPGLYRVSHHFLLRLDDLNSAFSTCRRTSASDASRMWVAPIPKWPYRDLNLFWDRLSALYMSSPPLSRSVGIVRSPSRRRPGDNTWRKRKSPAPSRYGRGAVGQLGVLSLPMQRPSFPFGLGPPLGQGWRAVKGPGPSRTSGWLVFCRLNAVYGCSETSRVTNESTTYYYT